jgi:hypothetical protein
VPRWAASVPIRAASVPKRGASSSAASFGSVSDSPVCQMSVGLTLRPVVPLVVGPDDVGDARIEPRGALRQPPEGPFRAVSAANDSPADIWHESGTSRPITSTPPDIWHQSEGRDDRAGRAGRAGAASWMGRGQAHRIRPSWLETRGQVAGHGYDAGGIFSLLEGAVASRQRTTGACISGKRDGSGPDGGSGAGACTGEHALADRSVPSGVLLCAAAVPPTDTVAPTDAGHVPAVACLIGDPVSTGRRQVRPLRHASSATASPRPPTGPALTVPRRTRCR